VCRSSTRRFPALLHRRSGWPTAPRALRPLDGRERKDALEGRPTPVHPEQLRPDCEQEGLIERPAANLRRPKVDYEPRTAHQGTSEARTWDANNGGRSLHERSHPAPAYPWLHQEVVHYSVLGRTSCVPTALTTSPPFAQLRGSAHTGEGPFKRDLGPLITRALPRRDVPRRNPAVVHAITTLSGPPT
jgi:hypothetical protein